VPILLGLGIQEVSAVVPAIPTIKSLVRAISLTDARKKARYALTLDSAAEVRALYPLEDYEL
jgi:phosphocarrier protein FPr